MILGVKKEEHSMKYIEPEMEIIHFDESVMTNDFIEKSTNNEGFIGPDGTRSF